MSATKQAKNRNKVDIHLNRPQKETFVSVAKETFMVGGVGMGKSYLLSLLTRKAIGVPGTVILIAAPTRGVLRDATLPQIQVGWQHMDFIEGRDYVINRRPPAAWGVKPYSTLSSHSMLTTRWGSYAVLDGLDNYNKHRGAEFDEIFVDELRDVNPEARTVLVGRLRGRAYKRLGKKTRAWYVTTPPENPTYLKSLYDAQDEEMRFVMGTSMDNQRNLPPDYIDRLKQLYDDKTYEREVLGRLIFVNDSPFLYAFEDSMIGPTAVNPQRPVVISYDFNVNPMTAIAAQHFKSGPRRWEAQVLHEWRLEDSNIHKLLAKQQQWLRQHGIRRVEITGDATGQNRSPLLREHGHAYRVIDEELRQVCAVDYRVPRSNPHHIDSFTMCNSIVSRIIDLTIDPACRYLIEDIRAVQMGAGNKIKIDNPMQGHLLDTLRYYLHTYWGAEVPRSTYQKARTQPTT